MTLLCTKGAAYQFNFSLQMAKQSSGEARQPDEKSIYGSHKPLDRSDSLQ
jgi:hypothetical protein